LTTNLTVLANSAFVQNISICDGQSYYAGGAFQTQTGIYMDTLPNAIGCDSVITTNLLVLPNSAFTQTVYICYGDSVFLQSAWQSLNGTYIDHYTNSVGCDSLLTTVLIVYPPILTQVNATICNGETYYAGGANQSLSGLYIDTLTAASGCDSIIHTDLTVLPPIVTEVLASICDGQQYYAAGNWQNMPGTYVDTFISNLGCDSTVFTDLTVNPLPLVNLGNDTALCEGSSLLLNAGGDFSAYLWQNQSASSTLVAEDSGLYYVTVTDTFGCVSSDTLKITEIYPLPHGFLITDTTICGNIAFTIEVPGFENYLWSNGVTTAFDEIDREGNYTLQVTDGHGCTATETISVANICNDDLMVPNAFTPNGDGVNDVFLPIVIKNLSEYHLVIFNRWGMVIFESADPSIGWNGIDNGDHGEIGTYLWTIDYRLEEGTNGRLSGYVTLLR
jgi:gliding motility-associated-like protein